MKPLIQAYPILGEQFINAAIAIMAVIAHNDNTVYNASLDCKSITTKLKQAMKIIYRV
jgi:hypothetical protein